MQIDVIRERFAGAPTEFGPTPFWFLNDDLDEERLSLALKELKSKRIPGVIIHPRTGMEIEYLSDLFWERLRFICDTLKRLGMKGWIYDEYNWPSGPVGGRLLREHPEFKQTGLDYGLMPVSNLKRFAADIPGELFAAYAIEGEGVVGRTEQLRAGDIAAFRGAEALVFFLREVKAPIAATCCAPWAKAETGYLDLLNPAAVDEFMRLTHFQYDQHLRQYYGHTLIGIFTDEPENYSSFPYTPGMPEQFGKRFERDFRSILPSLAGRFAGVPVEEHIRNRTNYFELARDLYVDSFFKRISAWAAERGLIFTGHLNEDDRIDRLPAANMSFYGPLSQMQMPGTDILGDRHGYDREHPALIHANFNPKALSSTAHHCGAGRTLCEIWGGNGWASTPERLKAVLNWAQACGVNFVVPHAAFMSLRGLRKRDYPASHFPPQPWWRFYGKFSEYISRLSFLNSLGKHVADALIAFPVKSLWADFDLRSKKNLLADFIEAVSEKLLRNQIDYDYLFDEVLDSGAARVEDSMMTVRGEKYSLLLLPLASVVPGKLLELTEQFAAAGGRIIAFGYELPTHDEYGAEVSARVEALFGSKEPANVLYRRLGADVSASLSWVVKKAGAWIRKDLVVDGPLAEDLICLHRKTDGADFYFIANLSDEEGQAEMAFRSGGRPQLWDPEDGATKDILAYKTEGDYTRISISFHPNQALFFAFLAEPPVEHVGSTNLHLTKVTADFAEGYTSALEVRIARGEDRYTRRVEQAFQPLNLPRRWQIDYPVMNVVLLDEWEIEILSADRQPRWSPRHDPRLSTRARLIIEAVRAALAAGRSFERIFGKPKFRTTKYEPISEAVDAADKWCKWLDIDLAQFDESQGILLKLAKYAGFHIGYDYPPAGCRFAMTTTFFADHVPEDLALVYEKVEEGPVSIQINGNEIDRKPEPVFVWDDSNRAVSISKLARKGENRLRLEWRQPDFPTLYPSVHGIEPVCLAGTFWLKKGRIQEQQYGAPTLPWSEIGLPNYIGSLTYRSSFDLPASYLGQQLFLKFNRMDTAAEVKINDKEAGVILWRPYVLDVTNLLVQGENSIEITIANTAANLLGKPVPAGLIGRPYIVPYWRHRVRLAK